MITDSIDGYLARRSRSASRFGAILDPAMDKFFVYFALATLYLEGRMTSWMILAMLSRDFSVFLYAFLITAFGRLKQLEFRALRWGKVTTALQFVVLMGLVLDQPIPYGIFLSFAIMGVLAFFELLQFGNPFATRSTR